MTKTALMICLALAATTAIADDTPASVAQLVNEASADSISARAGAALAAKDSVTRATEADADTLRTRPPANRWTSRSI